MIHVELKNLVKKFGDFVAVDRINVSIHKGEFVCLLGGSGCGKTTTLRMIAGFERPTEGEILVDGKVINQTPAKSRNMGMVFQSYALFPTLTVYENIAFGLRVRKTSHTEMEERVHRLLKLAHMGDLSHRYPAQLSGGQQQRVALVNLVERAKAEAFVDGLRAGYRSSTQREAEIYVCTASRGAEILT